MVNSFLTAVPDYNADATRDGLLAERISNMAHWPEFPGARRRQIIFKLMTSVALLSLSAACTPAAKKHLVQSQPPPPALSKLPLKQAGGEKNPLHTATAYWGKAYQANPNDPKAALNYARNLKAMGSTGKASSVLKHAYRAHPEHKGIASEYGRIILAKDQVRPAMKALKTARRSDGKTDWRVLSALGTAHAKLGKHAAAQKYYAAAIKKNPDAPTLKNNLALSYAMSGKPAKAETMLRRVMASGYDTPRVRQNLALVLGLQRKFNEAQQIASLDMSKEHANSNVRYLRAMVKERSFAQASPKAVSAPRAPETRVANLPEPKAISLVPPLPERRIANAKTQQKTKMIPAQGRQLTSKTLPLPWAKVTMQKKLSASPVIGQIKIEKAAMPMHKPLSQKKPADAPKQPIPAKRQQQVPASSWITTIAQIQPGKTSSLVYHSGD